MTTKSQRERMEAIGQHVRRVRVFLHLTQEDLARAANVSQGAVSRLEGRTGMATPYLTILSVQRALCTRLRALDGDVALGDEVQAMLAHPSMLADDEQPSAAPSITADPALEQYLAAFHQVPPRAREHLLTIVQTLATITSERVGAAERAHG